MAILVLGLLLSGLGAESQPAPPDPAAAPATSLTYTVTIAPTGDDALDAALAATSQLRALQDAPPEDGPGLIARVTEDLRRLPDALRAEGYWGGGIGAEIAGLAPDSAALPAVLTAALRDGSPVAVRLLPHAGPRYKFGAIAVRPAPGADPDAVAIAAARVGIATGEPALIAPVLAAETGLITTLRDTGHPLATVVAREAILDYDRQVLDVTWRLSPGPVARFGTPVVTGEQRTRAAFLNRIAGRLAGETYSPAAVERARQALSGLGVFASVRAQTGNAVSADGTLPITFTVQERPLRSLGVSGAYETNYGLSGRVWWEHRNLFGGAERLRLEAEVSRLGLASPDDLNYRVSAGIRSPYVFGQPITLTTDIAALRERLTVYDRDAVTAQVGLERMIGTRWTLRAAVGAEIGRAAPDGEPFTDYEILSLPLSARWDATDNLLDPRRGARVTVLATPAYELLGAQSYAILKATGTTYLDIVGEGRGVLALRGVIGSLAGATATSVPPQQRFYAGGAGSVRGYDYLSIGPTGPTGQPTGGASLLEASVEWRQRLVGPWGMAVFVDAGAVGETSTPEARNPRIGAGAGVRYTTAIGPIRADVGFPLVSQEGSGSYGLYIGLGQAF
ncbi:autotransporter assembly complex protein TamA [Humitalea sp. 24SJ18S-53]|uniref:autotransporter assembly complex protein TamA n=1 Tax=Humitalea sp. 24SJ18S-53 TaxID=3422307 RepID=UPI003D67A632